MFEIIVDASFEGPSIVDVTSLFEDIEANHPIKIAWDNTHGEIAVLRKFPERNFILVVPDLQAKDRAVAALGLPLSFSTLALNQAHKALVDIKTYDWRGFCDSCKNGLNPKWLLLKLVADSLRRGKRPLLADILPKLLLDGINQNDVDILLRLRSLD